MQIDVNAKYQEYLSDFNEFLDNYLSTLDVISPQIIRDAMSYALKNGGKRVRPVLCLATCELLGGNIERAKYLALAIEMIHSYSLVHDDLPAMDNDDFRRGKPSTHKAFGEANGILAGDGLLNLAIETCLSCNNIDNDYVLAVKAIFELSGYRGMVGGQVLDLKSENNNSLDYDTLLKIYEDKCAKLIIAPIISASLLSGGKYYKELYKYGYGIGMCFQIIDDVMDVEGELSSIGKTPHKDETSGKLTSVKILGIEKAKQLANDYYMSAVSSIKDIPNNEFLLEFAKKLYNRKK